MGKRYFRRKLLNLLCILLLLLGYQTVVYTRAQNAQIDQLEYEIEAFAAGEEGIAEGSGSDILSNETSPGTTAGDGDIVYQDGTYKGTAQGFGGDIEVSVTVQEGKIASVEITKADGEDSTYLDKAKSVIESIIEQQSADVDTVSGATYSSGGIRDAAAAALKEAAEQ